ncbi:MAG: hypothetical protein AB1486_21650 [Planctomycetota bacterium]
MGASRDSSESSKGALVEGCRRLFKRWSSLVGGRTAVRPSRRQVRPLREAGREERSRAVTPDRTDGESKTPPIRDGASPRPRSPLRRIVSPRPYFEKARDALESHDDETALHLMHECTERFPKCAPAYSLMANIHERRFLRELHASDARLVVRYLRAACSLDEANRNLRARFERFLDLIGVEPHPGRPGSAGGPPAPDDEEVDERLLQIEEAGSLPGDYGEEAGRIRRERDRLRRCLGEVTRAFSPQRAAVLDTLGGAWDETQRLEEDVFVRLAAGLLRASQIATRRMGLGAFRGATLESAGGSLMVRRGTRNAVVALLPRIVSTYRCQERLHSLMQAPPATPDEGAGP